MKEMLLGFDARLDWSEIKGQEEIPDPEWFAFPNRATVTDYTWYSAFGGTYVGRGITLPERPFAPRWTGRVQGLWEELEQLQKYAHEKLGSTKYHIIAIAAYLSDSEKAEASVFFCDPGYCNIATPVERDEAWELLGYDVADRYLDNFLDQIFMSGSLFAEWSPYLNTYSLFSTIDMAFCYRDFALLHYDEGHSVEVYSIYRVAIV